MAIHDGTTVVGVAPRISQAKFAAILHDFDSPARAEAEAGWAAVAEHGVDPLFALAMFHQESQFGTDGVCRDFDTRNPGNRRGSRTGVFLDTIDSPQFGKFVRYASWTDGWRDLAFSLVDESFVYHQNQLRAIRPIIETWAPRGDRGNDPEIYIARVVANMNAWQERCNPVPPPAFDGTDKPIEDIVFHAAARTVEAAMDGLRCRQWADPTSCETREPLRQGETFEALYWIEGVEVDGERRWWVAKSGSRIWSGGTVQRPGDNG